MECKAASLRFSLAVVAIESREGVGYLRECSHGGLEGYRLPNLKVDASLAGPVFG